MASAEATRGAGLFLISLNGIYTGGPDLIKNRPGVRCCGRRGGLSGIICSHRERQKLQSALKEGPGRQRLAAIWPRPPARPGLFPHPILRTYISIQDNFFLYYD